jgi:hypothetical protein
VVVAVTVSVTMGPTVTVTVGPTVTVIVAKLVVVNISSEHVSVGDVVADWKGVPVEEDAVGNVPVKLVVLLEVDPIVDVPVEVVTEVLDVDDGVAVELLVRELETDVMVPLVVELVLVVRLVPGEVDELVVVLVVEVVVVEDVEDVEDVEVVEVEL